MQLECFCRFSLSPRGDGNQVLHSPIRLLQWIFFIPARGRKRLLTPAVYHAGGIFFIPARGRKHPPESALIVRIGFSLSPRGDGNPVIHSQRPHSSRFSLSPRGDGNLALSRSSIPQRIFFIPARGRKPLSPYR